MLFVCGITDRDDNRRILCAESRPSLENIDDLAKHAVVGSYDWGVDADHGACLLTAKIILATVTDIGTAIVYAEQYADSVVHKLDARRMWILPSDEVEEWLKKNRKAN